MNSGVQKLIPTSFLSQNYMMRNAVLAAMAEMILQVLNGDQLEEAARDTRDQFLDTLQAHGHDVNSFVRSRVLQLFTRIVQQKVNSLLPNKDIWYHSVCRPEKRGIRIKNKKKICPKQESRIQVVTTSNKGLRLPKGKDVWLHSKTVLCLNCKECSLIILYRTEKFLWNE